MRRFLFLGLLATSVPAHAQTVSLKCQILQSDGTAEFIFNLSEEQGRATYTVTNATRGTGAPQQKRALFTPEDVTVIASQTDLTEILFKISRVDLSFQRILIIGGNPPTIDKGTCALYEPPKQAF